MKLEILPKNKGLRRKKKRVGRGPSSGHGKTSGRGHKGQKARSGGSVRAIFEGGQTPLARKLPYSRGRGFKNFDFKIEYSIINIGDLDTLDKSITEITPDVLKQSGLMRANADLLKILGDGELSRPLKVNAHAFTASAKSKIEAAGGTILEL
ncbi:MAG: 50S ribosomal protein L15 [Verrucomicrobia bacterium]|nr:MAG: 50S ribosomal protein L15 [Verrucomicrobiota bacterium]